MTAREDPRTRPLGPLDPAPRSAMQAHELAQWIALAPFVFQAARALRDLGILAEIERAGPQGLALEAATQRTGLSRYGVRVLLEAGLAIGLVRRADEGYRLTKTAQFLLHDPLTRVNMNFAQDVNYAGLARLQDAVRSGAPEGLKTFGAWKTIYAALAHLPEPVRKSWFEFDHYYSDAAFPEALPHVFRRAPRRLLDIGGNTGKWALQCLRHDPQVRVEILDLPGQLDLARRVLGDAGLAQRAAFHEADLLDDGTPIPGGFDAVWMSQFLDCFSEEQVISILRRCRQALGADGRVYILEPFWDRHRFESGAFCLRMTSLYFTAMANGNSQLYHSDTFLPLVAQAGFEVEEQADNLGTSHTLLVCRAAT